MQLFRYNTKNRADRKFNTTGREKNPLALKFYANNLSYADRYKEVYTEDGDLAYTCDLEVAQLPENANLFDMVNCFESLTTFKNFVAKNAAERQNDLALLFRLNPAPTKGIKKINAYKEWVAMMQNNATLEQTKKDVVAVLQNTEFQELSDYEVQIELVAELKSLGYNGYKTKNEIALF